MGTTGHKIIECLELKGTHKDHGVQLLDPHKTAQKSDYMAESIVQTILELCQT